jgi:hypothetical protein
MRNIAMRVSMAITVRVRVAISVAVAMRRIGVAVTMGVGVRRIRVRDVRVGDVIMATPLPLRGIKPRPERAFLPVAPSAASLDAEVAASESPLCASAVVDVVPVIAFHPPRATAGC